MLHYDTTGSSQRVNFQAAMNGPSGQTTSYGPLGTTFGNYASAYIDVPANSPPATITVLSPNGGEVWTEASSQTIRWVSNGSDTTQPVAIYLERKSPSDTQFWNIGGIVINQPGSGSYTWNVSSKDTTNRSIPGSQYKILIGRNLGRGTGPVDESDSFFVINAPVNIAYQYAGQSVSDGINNYKYYVNVSSSDTRTSRYSITLSCSSSAPFQVFVDGINRCSESAFTIFPRVDSTGPATFTLDVKSNYPPVTVNIYASNIDSSGVVIGGGDNKISF